MNPISSASRASTDDRTMPSCPSAALAGRWSRNPCGPGFAGWNIRSATLPSSLRRRRGDQPERLRVDRSDEGAGRHRLGRPVRRVRTGSDGDCNEADHGAPQERIALIFAGGGVDSISQNPDSPSGKHRSATSLLRSGAAPRRPGNKAAAAGLAPGQAFRAFPDNQQIRAPIDSRLSAASGAGGIMHIARRVAARGDRHILVGIRRLRQRGDRGGVSGGGHRPARRRVRVRADGADNGLFDRPHIGLPSQSSGDAGPVVGRPAFRRATSCLMWSHKFAGAIVAALFLLRSPPAIRTSVSLRPVSPRTDTGRIAGRLFGHSRFPDRTGC